MVNHSDAVATVVPTFFVILNGSEGSLLLQPRGSPRRDPSLTLRMTGRVLPPFLTASLWLITQDDVKDLLFQTVAFTVND